MKGKPRGCGRCNKKVKLAFVLAGIGIFAAAALRCVQMLCFFDYDTGFVTDSGLLTYIYCGAAIGVSLLCMLLCRVDKKLCARIEAKRNAAAGASALLMCVFLFLCAAALLRDFYLYRNNQPTYFVQASHVTTHLPFAVLTLLFAIVSLIFSIIWLTGEGFPSGTGGLWAIGSVWGISYMIVTFMTYSAVATTEENIFTVGGGAMMLLFLLSEGKLLSGAGDEFDLKAVHEGRLSPVFFGSALTNFGVEPFLKKFLQMTPPPTARTADIGVIDPFDPHFSAFVFKIQANMNKAHRDRVAFMRICSGKFERGQEVLHVQSGKKMSLAAPQQLMAQDRSIVDEAYAGDIIGIFDPGVFSIGDTVCDPKHKCVFSGIPTFAPELFAVVRQKDTLKRKQFVKGVEQIAQEGAIQIFREPNAGMESVIVGVVGVLQFEVLEYRLKNEYNVEIIRENLPYEHVRWVENDEEDFDVKRLQLTSDTKIVEDLKGNTLLLFTSPWNITYATDHNEGLRLAEFSENA